MLGTGTYEKGIAGVLATVGIILDGNIPTNFRADGMLQIADADADYRGDFHPDPRSECPTIDQA